MRVSVCLLLVHLVHANRCRSTAVKSLASDCIHTASYLRDMPLEFSPNMVSKEAHKDTFSVMLLHAKFLLC